MPVELSVDQEELRALGRRFKDEADGKQLKKDLAANLKAVAEPAAVAVRSAMASLSGVPSAAVAAVSSAVKVSVRLSGYSTGASVYVNKSAAPGFVNAARSFNAPNWRHPLWGRDAFVPQSSSNPGFWDEQMKAFSPQAVEAIKQAVADMTERLAH